MVDVWEEGHFCASWKIGVRSFSRFGGNGEKVQENQRHAKTIFLPFPFALMFPLIADEYTSGRDLKLLSLYIMVLS